MTGHSPKLFAQFSKLTKTLPAGYPRLMPPRFEPTHTDKVLFPDKGYTKGDVLAYYQRIAPLLLPHLKDRPLTLERLPDGLLSPKSPHFWQKNTPSYYPSWVPRITLPTEAGKDVDYALCNDLETLLYLVNQGTITFHVYLSTTHDLDHPTYVVFDLDVSASTFANAVTIARQIKKQLDTQNAPSFPKTSGKTGLHILTPWHKGGYPAAREWAMAIADEVCATLPDIATTARSKAARGKKVYVDVVQNALGHHVVPPYTIRATATATVSAPLRWSQVTPRLDPGRFTIKTRFKSDSMAELLHPSVRPR
jgi:bifunctional non-homologous end joining protein LigD